MEAGIAGVETIAVNTDALDLLNTKADKKILIGKCITSGWGAGADPSIGKEAARESKEEIKKALQGTDMVFLAAGLGGGTGTGSLPLIAELTKNLGALVVAVVTLPFHAEGMQRKENAKKGLEELRQLVDTLIVIPNDRLLEIAPKTTLLEVFKLCDVVLINCIKGMVELITKPGLINRDFADIKTIIAKGGTAFVGFGESDAKNRALDSIEKAINNPLLATDIKNANGALIHIISSPDITLIESQKIVESVSSRLDKNAKILWGITIDRKLEKTIKTMLIVTGVNFSQLPIATTKKRMVKTPKVELVE
jgi:cell division protein FtsZ